jgi:hypothetical protein
MQSVLPFLVALARTNGIAFLIAFGVLIAFAAPLIWLARRAERRYLSESGAEVPASGAPRAPGCLAEAEEDTHAAQDASRPPQEGGKEDGIAGLPARQSIGITYL